MSFRNPSVVSRPEGGRSGRTGARASGVGSRRGSAAWRQRLEQAGFVVGTDLIFLLSCMLCIAVVAWGSLGSKIVGEWADIGSAIGGLNQTYISPCGAVYHVNDPVHNANNPIAFAATSIFTDYPDFCDQGCSCGVVMCIPADPEIGSH